MFLPKKPPKPERNPPLEEPKNPKLLWLEKDLQKLTPKNYNSIFQRTSALVQFPNRLVLIISFDPCILNLHKDSFNYFYPKSWKTRALMCNTSHLLPNSTTHLYFMVNVVVFPSSQNHVSYCLFILLFWMVIETKGPFVYRFRKQFWKIVFENCSQNFVKQKSVWKLKMFLTRF